jgi:hypothetical protein
MHSPEPWEAKYVQGAGWQVWAGGHMIATMVWYQFDGPKMNREIEEGNARMMGNAPKMLNALKVAEATIMRLNRHDSANGTLDVIRAAIAEAEPDGMTAAYLPEPTAPRCPECKGERQFYSGEQCLLITCPRCKGTGGYVPVQKEGAD